MRIDTVSIVKPSIYYFSRECCSDDVINYANGVFMPNIEHAKIRVANSSLQQGKVLTNSALQFLWQFREFSRNCSNQENQELLKQVTLRL